MIMWNTKKERNGFRGRPAKYKQQRQGHEVEEDLQEDIPLDALRA